MRKENRFPDGTPIDPWFDEPAGLSRSAYEAADWSRNVYEAAGRICNKLYKPQDYGIFPGGAVQTANLQALIDKISEEGGGTIVITGGTILTGALYLKQGVHLRLEADGVLKGSDDIRDYPLCETRIEGEN